LDSPKDRAMFKEAKGQSDTLNLISLDYVTCLVLGHSKILESMTFNTWLLFVILIKVVLDCGFMPTLLFTNMEN
jgi:hypothetical protein